MKRCMIYVSICLAGLMLFGCLPKLVGWSPDGQQGYVIDEKTPQLCLIGIDGPNPLGDDTLSGVKLAEWFPDSHHLLVVQVDSYGQINSSSTQPSVSSKNAWDEITSKLPTAERERIILLSKRLYKEALAFGGSWDEFQKTLENLSEGDKSAVGIYVRDIQNEGLREKFGESFWKALQDNSVTLYSLVVYEANDNQFRSAGEVILNTVNEIGAARISPDGKIIAFVQQRTGEKHEGLTLCVVPADGSMPPRDIVEGVSAHAPAWSPDGHHLIYARTNWPGLFKPDEVTLGTISASKVCKENGTLLEKIEGIEDLAGILFTTWTKVYCCKDGRIIFSSPEFDLPSTTKDEPEGASLFMLDPLRQATIARVLTRRAEVGMGETLVHGLFEVSPDDKHVCIVTNNEESAISIYTIATGDIQNVPTQCKMESMPAWRNADELSLIVAKSSPLGSPDHEELVLWSLSQKQARCISKDWPRPPDSQPASQPASTMSGK